MTSSDDPTPLIAEGRWHGRIATQPTGTGGFGYDPLFIPMGYEMTAASMAPDEKGAEPPKQGSRAADATAQRTIPTAVA